MYDIQSSSAWDEKLIFCISCVRMKCLRQKLSTSRCISSIHHHHPPHRWNHHHRPPHRWSHHHRQHADYKHWGESWPGLKLTNHWCHNPQNLHIIHRGHHHNMYHHYHHHHHGVHEHHHGGDDQQGVEKWGWVSPKARERYLMTLPEGFPKLASFIIIIIIRSSLVH